MKTILIIYQFLKFDSLHQGNIELFRIYPISKDARDTVYVSLQCVIHHYPIKYKQKENYLKNNTTTVMYRCSFISS